MTIEEILTHLKTDDYTFFPREALQAAILQQEAITPHLLDIVGRIATNPQLIDDDDPDSWGFTYALYLLAQFKENRAYPPIVHYFSQLGTEIEALDATGDIVTEDLQRILASVCHGDLSLIKQLIENSNINEYVRGAALEALVVLYNEDQLPRHALIRYFSTLIKDHFEQEEDDYLLTYLACCCDKIYPGELYDVLAVCFKYELIDTFMIDEEDINNTMRMGKESALAQLKNDKHYRYIDNAITDIEWWACFHPDQPVYTPPSTVPSIAYDKAPTKIKLGRNDPCFCGSGKKYKKCCLNG
ncbi:MAG: DUF1186 domain-containing protein [Methylococcales bacterium]|nr:DUF1186 domain-containing protein [Methylococcales bacterium]